MSHYAAQRFRQEIKKLNEKFDFPIEYGDIRFGTQGIIVEELRLGHHAPIVISEIQLQVDLRPWSDDFAKLSLLSVRHVRVKTPLSDLRSWHQLWTRTPQGTTTPSNGDPSSPLRLLDQIISASPASVLEILSAGVVLLSDQGNQLLALKGLKLSLDKKEKRLSFSIDRIRRAEGPLDSFLQGRLERNPSESVNEYRFFVRRRAGAETKKNLWSVSGAVLDDLSKWRLKGSFRSVPTFFGNSLEKFLGHQPRLAIHTQIEGVKSTKTTNTPVGRIKGRSVQSQNDIWNLAIDINSSNTYLDSKVLSSSTVGPVPFKVTATAQFNPSTRSFTINDGTLILPVHPNPPSDSQNIVAMNFSGRVQASQSTDQDSLQVSALLDIPETSCDNLVKAIPPSLAPLPQEFKLDGSTSALLNLFYDSKNVESSQFQLARSSWNCRVVEAPADLSRDNLWGPFEFETKKDPLASRPDALPLTLKISPENPLFASLATLPKNVIQAFISSEDVSFYSHSGIEIQALLGAFRKNLAAGRVAFGGSTITMQTAKNLFLSHERTFSRKVQELFLAWHLEKSLSKDRIMEIYLNIIEFGPGIYGIGHASRHFFDKDAQNLSLTEAAYLASTLPNPKLRYASFCQGRPTSGMNQLMTSLIRRMESLGRIHEEEMQQAIQTGLRFNEQSRAIDAECHGRTAAMKESPEENSRL